MIPKISIIIVSTVAKLRNSGVYAECDISARSLKAQMKYADKIGARYTLILGDSADSILEQGLLWMESIKNDEAQRTYARNPHELARVMEVETRITVGEMFLHACRIKLKTDKMDLPKGTYVFNHLEGSEVKTEYREKEYWLKHKV